MYLSAEGRPFCDGMTMYQEPITRDILVWNDDGYEIHTVIDEERLADTLSRYPEEYRDMYMEGRKWGPVGYSILYISAGAGDSAKNIKPVNPAKAKANYSKVYMEAYKGNKLPTSDSKLKHIFRNKGGHVPDTPGNRSLLESTANNPNNYLGKDKYGNDWYSITRKDGTQVWVQSRNGEIWDGGVNTQPRLWNSQTGLKSNLPPK